MLRDAINGLDSVFQTDVPKASIVLITGGPGSLKSAFVFNVLSNYLAMTEEFGVYVTMEEQKDSLLRNIKSLGIKESDKLEIYDYNDMIKERVKIGALDVKMPNYIIANYKEKEGDRFTCFALDSLNALYTLMPSENLRMDAYLSLRMLRNSGLTSFLILESTGTQQMYTPEYYLADGIIEVGTIETAEDVKRYIQVKKMRATQHSMKKHELIATKEGLCVRGPLYVR